MRKLEKRIIFNDEIIAKNNHIEIFYNGKRTTIYNSKNVESKIVLGRARKQRRLIKVWMKQNFITNWRIKKVYNPFVINSMLNNFGWDETDESKMQIISILKFLKPDYVFDENNVIEKE